MIQLIISETVILDAKYSVLVPFFPFQMRSVNYFVLWFISLTFSNSLCAVCNVFMLLTLLWNLERLTVKKIHSSLVWVAVSIHLPTMIYSLGDTRLGGLPASLPSCSILSQRFKLYTLYTALLPSLTSEVKIFTKIKRKSS